MKKEMFEERVAILKQTFAELRLKLEEVWTPNPTDPRLEASQLSTLLDWVRAYATCPNPTELRRRGYMHPPLLPGFGPESDWLRFERWVNGKPLSWRYTDEYGALPAITELTEEGLQAALEELNARLAERGVTVEFCSELPPRRAYEYLRTELSTRPFEYAAKGTFTVITGCTGYCPGCFQRQWCDLGQESEWPEDKEQPAEEEALSAGR